MPHEKAQEIFDELVQRGEAQSKEAKDWVERLVHRGQEEHQATHKLIHDQVKSALSEVGLATKQDVQALAAQIDALGKQGKA
jgi:polyhydroxyalkanoate synthesis regulator phasin